MGVWVCVRDSREGRLLLRRKSSWRWLYGCCGRRDRGKSAGLRLLGVVLILIT
jgi:hypothetical protein